MVLFICNRKTNERVYGPFKTPSSARSSMTQRKLSNAEFYVADENWRERERFRQNLIDVSRFGLAPIEDHFLHVSVKNERDDADALMVSFTANEDKGRQDRQEAGRRIGRYLKEFYPHLDSDDITRLSGEISAIYNPLAIRFARTRQEIRWVYENCRNHCGSCMTHVISYYNERLRNAGVHPVEAYAGPDLAVAYQLNAQGEVTGRALCWPEKKEYGRVYSSDQSRFTRALQDLGYSNSYLRGARMDPILLIEEGNNSYYAMPYIDYNDQYVTFDGQYFIIGNNKIRGGQALCSGTSGIVSMTVYRDVLNNEVIVDYSDVIALRHPSSRGITLYTRSSTYKENVAKGLFMNLDGYSWWMGTGNDADYFTANDGVRVPLRAVGNTYKRCPHDGKIYHSDNMLHGYAIENFLKHYVVCEDCLSIVNRNDAIWMEHGAWWSKSYFRNNGVTVDGRNYAKNLERKVA